MIFVYTDPSVICYNDEQHRAASLLQTRRLQWCKTRSCLGEYRIVSNAKFNLFVCNYCQ